MIDITEYAVWVHKLVNTDFYERVLSAFQREASEQGFAFIESDSHCALTAAEERLLGAAVLRARIEDCAPLLGRFGYDNYVNARIGDGEAQRWTQWLLDALGKRGIAIARIRAPRPKDEIVDPFEVSSAVESFFSQLGLSEEESADCVVYSGSRCTSVDASVSLLKA